MNIRYDMLEHGSLGNNPKMIVVHAMGELINNGKKIQPARDFLDEYELSAHVLAEPNGDLIVCRSEDQVAWHARGYNQNSLGIEILVPGEHNYGSFLKAIKKTNWATDEQMQSAAEQIAEWQHIYHINIDKVVRHSDLSPDRKVDPGSGFNWVAFQKLIKKAYYAS